MINFGWFVAGTLFGYLIAQAAHAIKPAPNPFSAVLRKRKRKA